MHTELTVPLAALYGFLMVLARVAGVIAFVPLPGLRDSPEAARVILALALTIVLFPAWPALPDSASFGLLAVWAASESVTGLLIGLMVSLLFEGIQMAAHMVELQAGFSYASTVDPATQADSSIFQVATQLFAGLLFFALGLDRQVVRILIHSFVTLPPGAYPARLPLIEVMVRAGAGIFVTGLRLSLPVLALLILLDMAVAVLGRIQAQLQLLSLSFTLKILAGAGMMAGTLAFYPPLMENLGNRMLLTLQSLLHS